MGEFKKSGGFGGNKNRGGFGGGRPGFSGGRPSFGGNRDERRSEMFQATCDNCHKQCEVPFRPTGSKPVYCNNCFSSKKEERDGGFEKREAPKQYPSRNDVSFSIPTKPKSEDKRIDELKIQVNALNAKVDTILRLLQSNVPAQTSPVQTESIKITTANKSKPVVKKVALVTATVKKVATKLPAKKRTTAKKK